MGRRFELHLHLNQARLDRICVIFMQRGLFDIDLDSLGVILGRDVLVTEQVLLHVVFESCCSPYYVLLIRISKTREDSTYTFATWSPLLFPAPPPYPVSPALS